MMMKQFDYGIIGAGAAGLQLALAIINDEFFKQKKILIIDKDKKTKNDKTWCFWEKGKGKWDNIVSSTWQKCLFADEAGTTELSLKPFTYKKIRSIDFYMHAINLFNTKENITFAIEKVESINEVENGISISCNKNNYTVNHCFDSRIEAAFYNNNKYPTLQQHFEGWWINFENEILDETTFTVMDYRASYNNTTSFMYVLPLNKKQALFEFTGFTKAMFDKEVYAKSIENYIKQYVTKGNYTVIEKEAGVIPMSTFPFEKVNTRKLTKIGTAGGWVRPSSGYSFKNSEQYVAKIINNLQKGKIPSQNFVNKKHRFFDAVLLDVLSTENSTGWKVFSNLYKKNKLFHLLKFLDGATSFGEDLRIMNSVDKQKFTKAALRMKRQTNI